MSNPANNGTVIGRLASDPKIFDNQDGSKTVKFSVYADNDYKGKDGKRGSVAVPVESFVPAATATRPQSLGIVPFIGKGDLVAVGYGVRANNYTDKSGVQRFEIVLSIDSITPLEPKSITDARRQKAAAPAATATAPAADESAAALAGPLG